MQRRPLMKVDGLLSEPLARCLAVWQPHASSCFVASHESPGQYGVVYGMWVRLVILCTWANARKSNKKRREEKLIQFVLRVRGSAWVSKNYCLRERMIRYMPVQHYARSLFNTQTTRGETMPCPTHHVGRLRKGHPIRSPTSSLQ